MKNNEKENMLRIKQCSLFEGELPLDSPTPDPPLDADFVVNDENSRQPDEKSMLQGLFILFSGIFAEERYAETGNAIYAWQRYALSRNNGAPVPEWVLECFDIMATNFDKIFNGDPDVKGKRISEKIAWATNITVDRPGLNKVGFDYRDREICFKVWSKVNFEKKTTEVAFGEVAKEVGCGSDTVKVSFYKFKAELDELGQGFLKKCAVK